MLRSIQLFQPTWQHSSVSQFASTIRSMEIRLYVSQFNDSQIKEFLITVLSKRLALKYSRLLYPFKSLNLSVYQWSCPSSIRHLTVEEISWSNLLTILCQTRNLIAFVNLKFEPSILALLSLRKLVLNIHNILFTLLKCIRRLKLRLKRSVERTSRWNFTTNRWSLWYFQLMNVVENTRNSIFSFEKEFLGNASSNTTSRSAWYIDIFDPSRFTL